MPTLVDSNVILDIFTEDPKWFEWSSQKLAECAEKDTLIINPIIYAEVSIRFERIEELEEALPPEVFFREDLPWEAAFLAGKCFLLYRRRKGKKLFLFQISTLESMRPCGAMLFLPGMLNVIAPIFLS